MSIFMTKAYTNLALSMFISEVCDVGVRLKYDRMLQDCARVVRSFLRSFDGKSSALRTNSLPGIHNQAAIS